MMGRKVFFVMSGNAHMPYLTVSLRSLREHWDGQIEVHAWPECSNIMEHLAQDPSLDITWRVHDPVYRGKNDQFLAKSRIAQTLDPSCSWVYLDADTIVNGPLDRLFHGAEQCGFCLTQFNNWNTSGGVIKGRILNLKGREPIDQDLVERLLKENWPSVNGGIWACKPDSPALKLWSDWTSQVLDIFIADETVLHVVMLKLEGTHPREVVTLLGGRYNCSPKFQPKHLTNEDVVVWHGHGDCFTRPGKTLKGYELWWPKWQECLNLNIGNCQEWIQELEAPTARNSWKKLTSQIPKVLKEIEYELSATDS